MTDLNNLIIAHFRDLGAQAAGFAVAREHAFVRLIDAKFARELVSVAGKTKVAAKAAFYASYEAAVRAAAKQEA